MRSIFIIGEQRSGSNLLRLMLSQAGIAAPHPPHILKRMLPLESSYGDLSLGANWTQLVEDTCRLVDRNPVPWGEVSPLDRDEVMKRCEKRSTVAIFGAVMDLYAESCGATMWACKSMQYSEFVADLEAHFAAPLYIYLYRDGRDVTLSFKRAVVGEKHPYFIAKRWAHLQEAAARVQGIVGPERCFALCYEELTREPEPVLRAMCSFLGVPFSKKMLEFHRSSDAKSSSGKSQLWQNVGRPLMKNNSRKFLKGLTKTEIEICESVAGPQLDRMGYERVHVPIGGERTFSMKEIEEFERDNKQLKVLRRSAMDSEDAARRSHQMSLLTERVQHLQHLPRQYHLRLLAYLEERHLDGDVVFIEAGSTDRNIYFVIEGVVEVLDSAGEVLTSLEAGSCVGEVGLLAGLSRTRDVRTVGATRLFVLSYTGLQQMLMECPALASHLLWSISHALAGRFHEMSRVSGK